MDFWKKLRTDGPLGMYVLTGALAAAMRRGGRMPAIIRARWNLGETETEIDHAYEEFGRYLSARLAAGQPVDPADEQAVSHTRRIDALHDRVRRLRETLTLGIDG